jgi:isopenicillin N synthase-like dioxygenase
MIFFAFLLAMIFSADITATELDIRIPVVDMQDFDSPERRGSFIDRLSQAMREVGFFAVRNTGVDRNTIRSAYSQAEEFFKQERAYKERSFAKELHGQRGFVPGETAKGCAGKDMKEFYHIGRELGEIERERLQYAPNVWPDQFRFKEDMITLYSELERYVGVLFEAIVEAINRKAADKIPSDLFSRMTQDGNSLLRALYYPALSQSSIDENIPWAAPHTDIDLLAILPYATEKGLQVEIDGQWLTVVVPEDAFIVNVGDMLENLTNGLFKSARHRVVALEPGKERFSMVFFVHPTDDASLTPLPSCIAQTGVQRYAPGTRKEFLWERLLELNIAPLLLEPYSKTGHTERQMRFGRQSPQIVQMLLEKGLASQELLDAISRK